MMKTMRMKNQKNLLLGKALIISIFIICPQVWADSKEDFNSWQNTLAPLYLWGVSMSGDMTSGPVSAALDLDFSDAVSELEVAYTVHYEGAKGNWGVIVDYSFLNLTPSVEVPGTPGSVDVDMDNVIAEIAGLYRFSADNPWQLLAGYRRYELDITVKGLPSPPLPISRVDISETIEDFFIGGRYVQGINDNWTFIGRADVGTGDSDLVWNLLAAFNYRFNEAISAMVGWRVLDYDVDTGSGADQFKYDMNHSGPLLALAFHW